MAERRNDQNGKDSPEKKPAEVSRRDIALMLGGLGAAALAGCAPGSDGAAFGSDIGSHIEAATGTSIRWADTVLGAAPPSTRTGDLATHTSSQLANAIVVIAKGCVTAGDGGGGVFYWSSTSGTDDGGTVIVPNGMVGSTGACWKRLLLPETYRFNVLWFGLGTDLTIPLNAADAALGSNYGEIFVPPGNYAINTQIVLSDNRKVHFGAGVYENNNPTWTSLFGHNTTIEGDGWNTQLRQSRQANGGDPMGFGIRAFELFHSKYHDINNQYAGSQNVIFRNFRVLPPSVTVNGTSSTGAIALANGVNTVIDNVLFDQTMSYGVAVGGSSSQGFYAINTQIINCNFNRTFYEAIGIVNADGTLIEGCIFVAGPWAVGIDFEPNVPTIDRCSNFVISGNFFDHRIPTNTGASGGDVGVHPGTHVGPGLICDNVCIGGDQYAVPATYWGTSSLNLLGGSDISIVNNSIVGYQIAIDILSGSTRSVVSLNKISACSTTGIAVSSIGNVIKDNKVETLAGRTAIAEIVNGSPSPDSNRFDGNDIISDPTVPVPLVLLGPNSRAWNNFINGKRQDFTNDQQAVSAASTISISPFGGRLIRINLSATAITAVNADANQGAPYPGQEMITEIAQDATGGRSISGWSSAFVFASAYTPSSAANRRDLIRWIYDGTAVQWIEIGRTMNV